MARLYIDVETRSDVDISKSGIYKYVESDNFKVILVAYALDDNDVVVVDLIENDYPTELVNYFKDPTIELHAWNAAFERVVFEKEFKGLIPLKRWYCSMAKSAMAGFPLQLTKAGEALQIDKAKLDTGKELIKLFCIPKPKAVGIPGQKTLFEPNTELFNNPYNYVQEWEDFKTYNRFDVEAEREIDIKLNYLEVTPVERNIYLLDQTINDNGVQICRDMVEGAEELGAEVKDTLIADSQRLTGLDNPNSAKALKNWLEKASSEKYTSTAKDYLKDKLKQTTDPVIRAVISNRLMVNKSSVSKYLAMDVAIQLDGRIRGLSQYYGARTGRWAGRRVQLQNIPQNKIDNEDLDLARELVKSKDLALIETLYGNTNDILSQLIRTAIIAPKGKSFAVADFSAIEARVLAWLAKEMWRLEVFATHGKIYEASASMMFGVPLASVTKDSDYRKKGKIAELALGYGGSVGAFKAFGAEKMGLTETDMEHTVSLWREKSPNIVNFWYRIDKAVIDAVKNGTTTVVNYVEVGRTKDYFYILLPSGRKLYYNNPTITQNKWGRDSVAFRGLDDKNNYVWIETYGGKLTENIVQAIARDILAIAMLRLYKAGFKIVMHVHDEVVAEAPEELAEEKLKEMCHLLGLPISWAKLLPLNAEGFTSKYYKK